MQNYFQQGAITAPPTGEMLRFMQHRDTKKAKRTITCAIIWVVWCSLTIVSSSVQASCSHQRRLGPTPSRSVSHARTHPQRTHTVCLCVCVCVSDPTGCGHNVRKRFRVHGKRSEWLCKVSEHLRHQAHGPYEPSPAVSEYSTTCTNTTYVLCACVPERNPARILLRCAYAGVLV